MPFCAYCKSQVHLAIYPFCPVYEYYTIYYYYYILYSILYTIIVYCQGIVLIGIRLMMLFFFHNQHLDKQKVCSGCQPQASCWQMVHSNPLLNFINCGPTPFIGFLYYKPCLFISFITFASCEIICLRMLLGFRSFTIAKVVVRWMNT